MKTNLYCILILFLTSNHLQSQPNTVKIGQQVWMTKNLDVEKFRNGDLIPQAATDKEWIEAYKSEKPAWCYYDYNPKYGAKFGKLYNKYAVIDPRGLAPKGYHIPNGDEWRTLVHFLGINVAAKKMKSSSGWKEFDYAPGNSAGKPYPSKGSGCGTNSSGFNAYPSGYRKYTGEFRNIGIKVFYWSSKGIGLILINSEDDCVEIDFDSEYIYSKAGYSVRCIKGESATNPVIFVYDSKGYVKQLTKNEEYFINRVISSFKLNNRSMIADLISYPFSYSYYVGYYTQDSIITVKTKEEFMNKIDEILDDNFISAVARVDIHEFRYDLIKGGFYIGKGNFYIGRNGKISDIKDEHTKNLRRGAGKKAEMSSDTSSVR
jgi:uncharacterized protein (TIGR02145 family)